MTLSDILAIAGGLSTLGALIMFFAQRKRTNRSLDAKTNKDEKETKKLEQEIENKYTAQVKQWINDLHEIKEKHDSDIEKKEGIIEELHHQRLTLTTELTSATLRAGQCGRATRRLFTALHIPYWECDRDGKLIFANGAWLTLFGLSKQDAMGEGWLQSIPEAERQSLLVSWYSKVVDETDGEIDITVKNAVTNKVTVVKSLYSVKFDTRSEVYKIIGATVPPDWTGFLWDV